MRSVNLQTVFKNNSDPSVMFDSFCDKISQITDKHIPARQLSRRELKFLRACPREDQAGVAHAISPIFFKLGLVKGFTEKLHRTKPFDLWIFPCECRPPPSAFQGKPLKTHQNMAVKLEALLLLLFSRFYFYLALALGNPLLVHSESFASRGLMLVNQCQSIVDHVMTKFDKFQNSSLSKPNISNGQLCPKRWLSSLFISILVLTKSRKKIFGLTFILGTGPAQSSSLLPKSS